MFPTRQEQLHYHIPAVNHDDYISLDQFSSSNTFLDQSLYNREEDLSNDIRSKKYLSKAERRAEHNAIERARRESLNTKFQSLAQLLPNLINYRRPSKSQIVEKTLEWVKQSLSRDERQRYQILQLQIENRRLMTLCISQQQEKTQYNHQHQVKTHREQNQQPYQFQNQHSYQKQKNTPIINHVVSNNNNSTSISPNTSASNNFATTGTYSNDVIDFSSQKIQSQLLDPHYRVSIFSAAGELTKEYSSPKSDDSINDDDVNYQRSHCTFNENLYLQKQLNKERQHYVVSGLHTTRTKNFSQQDDLYRTRNG